jgi:RNA polymerase sigma-54 factor
MALATRLEFRQGQTLTLTPQLQQAIKLLQMSAQELDAFVQTEIEANPLLVAQGVEEPDMGLSEPVQDRQDLEVQTDEIDLDGAAEALDMGSEDLFADASLGEQDSGELNEIAYAGAPTDLGRIERHEGSEGFEDRAAQGTLADAMRSQLAIRPLDGRAQSLAHILIDGLDEAGYLRLDLTELATRLDCRLAEIEQVLTTLQGFEPVGVFARDLRECLALQLKDKNRLDPAMDSLLDHLDVLARQDHARLRLLCSVNDEDLRDMIAEIRALNPRPGAGYDQGTAQTLIPDVYVRQNRDFSWHVELNSDTLPKLLIDRRYHAHISGLAKSEADKVFVSDCLANATWLVKSLDQRAKTILKVASEIVKQQEGFLNLGLDYLRPLTLKTVAEAIGMHESTVSRVTANKAMATPRGTFELKFFFTSAIAACDGGTAHSSQSVRQRIRQLIQAEHCDQDVLSDDKLVELLQKEGIDIARRTVTKYREAMGIGSSVDRRRLFKAAG